MTIYDIHHCDDWANCRKEIQHFMIWHRTAAKRCYYICRGWLMLVNFVIIFFLHVSQTLRPIKKTKIGSAKKKTNYSHVHCVSFISRECLLISQYLNVSRFFIYFFHFHKFNEAHRAHTYAETRKYAKMLRLPVALDGAWKHTHKHTHGATQCSDASSPAVEPNRTPWNYTIILLFILIRRMNMELES